jgi:predicted porin
MKKSAIALAVAAALGMSAASQAETILYGSARVSVDYLDIEPADDDDASVWEVVNNSSRLGVRGAEDLGNGLSAIYQYEFGIDVTGDGNYFNSNRPRWAGLKGGFGAVTLGTQWTPFYNVIGVTDVLNSGKSFDYYLAGDTEILGLGETFLDRGIADFRTGNSILYVTPDIFGLTAEAMLSMDGDDDDGLTEDDDPNSIDRWEANIKYENGPIFAGVAYIQEEQTDDEQWGAALGYLGDAFGVVASYQLFLPEDAVDFEPVDINGDGITSDLATDDLAVYSLQGTFSFGNNIAYATYAYTDPDATDFEEVQHVELGLEHYFSERTRIWAEGIYAFNEADIADTDDASALAVSLGVRHDF